MKKDTKIGLSKKVFVAMSGGVDSSVSAALLKRDGFDVTGVYMKQWSPKILGQDCIWKQERQDAMKVAAQLGIKFLTWDFSKEYEKQVGRYMIEAYKKGITPNPDVMCNKVIKFGLFFDKAMEEGADFIATGHYARTSLSKFSSLGNLSLRGAPQGDAAIYSSGLLRRLRPPRNDEKFSLLKAKDKNKDQTYFLWALKQKHLAKTLFPVGDLTKPEVRKLAKKFGLHNAEKKDSQGVCFIGLLDMKNFLKNYIKPKEGKIFSIIDTPVHRCTGVKKNVQVGTHDGVYYYTIGQRHGLDIKDGKGPYFVVKKDVKKNIIYVGKEKDLYSKRAKIKNINWISGKKPKLPLEAKIMVRYRTKPANALIRANKGNSVEVVFDRPQKAITPGQSAVFYAPVRSSGAKEGNGSCVLGGGIIDRVL